MVFDSGNVRHRRRLLLHLQLHFANLNDVVGLEVLPLARHHAIAIDVRAVGAVEILNGENPLFAMNDGVLP